MVNVVPANEIEKIVGRPRHPKAHFGKSVSAERTVYILHSQECFDSGVDLRECRFSVALNNGIEELDWIGVEDRPVMLGVAGPILFPIF